VEEGALYPALHRLEASELLASEWRISETNRRAKFYRLTSAGNASIVRIIELEPAGGRRSSRDGVRMTWWERLRRRSRLEQDLVDEIAFHREMRSHDPERPVLQ